MALKKAEKGTKRVQFVTEADGAKNVFVSGTFNNWHPSDEFFRLTEDNGIFVLWLYFQKGTYEYKFVVDGVWFPDIHQRNFSINKHGTLNSVLVIE